MTIKHKLIQEIEQSSDEEMKELFNFLQTIKKRKKIKQSQLRPYGLCEGEFITPENFDNPLPDEILKQFE